MEWVRFNDAEIDKKRGDQPRFLDDNDIVRILATYINNRNSKLYFPEPPGADKDSRALARKCTVDWIISEMRKIQIAPSLVPKMIYIIIRNHYKSLVTPGTPVAIGAGHSVGATNTQMTLNSVAPWEKLLIQRKNGVGAIVEIGGWIDRLIDNADPNKIQHFPENRTEYFELDKKDRVRIVTSDNDGKVTWEDVTAVTRHLPIGDLVKVTTKSGRVATATQQKGFLIWDDVIESLIKINGNDLKIGDLIPIANEIPEPAFTYDVLDLKEYLDTTEWMFTSEMEKLHQDYTNYNVPGKQRFWSSADRLENVPYNRGDSFLVGYRGMSAADLQPNCVYPKSWGGSSGTCFPEQIKLDRKFGVIVGLYLAEGLVTDTYMMISNNDAGIRELVYDWCDSLGIWYHTDVSVRTSGLHQGTSTDIRIHSVLLARFFKIWTNTGSARKVMPEEILFGNKEFIIGVLDGYMAGDGTVNKNDGSVSVSSVSEALIDGFIFLCSRLGIFSKKSSHQAIRNNKGSKVILRAYVATIRSFNADLWYKIIGSCHGDKQRRMENEYSRTAEWGKFYKKHNNLMLDPIEKIEYVKDVKYVYDITVPKTYNFALYNGQILDDTFHSSGSAVSASLSIDALRDIIYARKIPKNEGCTIYYKNKYITYEEVLDSRKYIVGTVISDLVLDFDIDTPENIKGGQKWWNSAHLLYDNELPESTLVMRLFLDVVQMYKHKITIKQLAEILERETSLTVPSVVVRYGPMTDGIIDIYPSEKIKQTVSKVLYKNTVDVDINSSAESTYLESIVYPELNNIRVKGIKGLRNLYPRVIPVWSIVFSEKKIIDNTNQQDKWILKLDPDKMYLQGLGASNIIRLCESAGLESIKIDEQTIQVTMNDAGFTTSKGDQILRLGDVDYRKINISDITNETPTIREMNGLIYERLDSKTIKNLPKTGKVLTEIDQYQIEIEGKSKLSVGPTRWIEEEIPAKIINVPKDEVIQFEKEYYRLVKDLRSVYDSRIHFLNNLKIVDGKLYNGNKILDNLYQELNPNDIKVVGLKPSEYVNNKISAMKKLYRDQVAKKTNENIENDRKNKRFKITKVNRQINFPRFRLVTNIPYDSISTRDINQFLTDNKIEVKPTRDENFVSVIRLINTINYINLPSSINDWLKEGGDISSERVDDIINVEEDIEEEIKDDNIITFRTPVNIERPEILKLSELVVADVDIIAPENVNRVTIFKSLLGLHSIDKRRTTCNNMHTLSSTFGIESVRSFIIKRLYEIISGNGSYIHPANIMFIAEFITSRGVPYGTTFTGISRQPGGHLSLATVERAGKTFTQHALHGRKEDIRNVSASISVGARMVIGNGMFDIAQDIVKNNKPVVLINDDVFKAHEMDEREEEEEDEGEEEKEEEELTDAEKLARETALVLASTNTNELDATRDTKIDIDLEVFKVDPDVIIGYVEPPLPKKRVITKIIKGPEKFQPIISAALVIPIDLEPRINGNGVPETLMILLDRNRDTYEKSLI
jgi:intein/homing endonuclease